MYKNQKGIAHIFLILLLLAGIIGGVYVVQQRTNLFSKAGGGPINISGPEVVIDSQNKKFSTSPTVEVELHSPYGAPQSNQGGVAGPR